MTARRVPRRPSSRAPPASATRRSSSCSRRLRAAEARAQTSEDEVALLREALKKIQREAADATERATRLETDNKSLDERLDARDRNRRRSSSRPSATYAISSRRRSARRAARRWIACASSRISRKASRCSARCRRSRAAGAAVDDDRPKTGDEPRARARTATSGPRRLVARAHADERADAACVRIVEVHVVGRRHREAQAIAQRRDAHVERRRERGELAVAVERALRVDHVEHHAAEREPAADRIAPAQPICPAVSCARRRSAATPRRTRSASADRDRSRRWRRRCDLDAGRFVALRVRRGGRPAWQRRGSRRARSASPRRSSGHRHTREVTAARRDATCRRLVQALATGTKWQRLGCSSLRRRRETRYAWWLLHVRHHCRNAVTP